MSTHKKAKKSALRGPKLFGKLGPKVNDGIWTIWEVRGEQAYTRKRGRAWVIFWPGLSGEQGAYDSAASAKKGLERDIVAVVKIAKRLGCP